MFAEDNGVNIFIDCLCSRPDYTFYTIYPCRIAGLFVLMTELVAKSDNNVAKNKSEIA